MNTNCHWHAERQPGKGSALCVPCGCQLIPGMQRQLACPQASVALCSAAAGKVAH